MEYVKDGDVVRFLGTTPLVPQIIHYYYWYSALGPVWAETRVQSGDWYGSGTLHPGQVLRGSLPLLSPVYCTDILFDSCSPKLN